VSGGGSAFLRFDGVYMLADVWCNGQHLGLHPYGYTTFQYDVTALLHTDGSANVVAVRVNNGGRNSRWYSGSGIFRHVWLTSTPPLHVQLWGVGVATQVAAGGASASATVTVTAENGGAVAIPAGAVTVTAVLAAPDGSVVATVSAPLPPLAANASADVVLSAFDVDAPALWSLGGPQQYSVLVTIADARSGAIDAVSQRFGFRSIAFSVDRGFELNGVALKMQGGCVHHDNGIVGSAAIDAAEWRRVAALKALGYNAIRTSHNPVSEAFLEAADALGVLVMEEAFDTWSDGKNSDDYHEYFTA
jgi:beta-galactosidase